MSNPYFEVGEEVILYSKMRPECNGDATVFGAYTTEEEKINRLIELNSPTEHAKWNNIGGILYELDIPCIDKEGLTILWAESALRKKHKPNKDSFGTMLHKLNHTKATT